MVSDDQDRDTQCHSRYGLNPCFNGRWSLTLNEQIEAIEAEKVLILVLMEDGL